MKVPNCPEHGDLVLDLARGRLSDAEADEAELVRASCPHCAGWWDTAFAGRGIAEIDKAVAEVFAGFSPRSGRRRVWLAVAAAVVFAVGLGLTSMLWNDGDVSPLVAEQGPGQDAVLSTWDFEDGTLKPASAHADAAEAPAGETTDEAVFVNDLESGDLGGWTIHS